MKKKQNKNKATKRELMQENHLTRPPRLEGKAKNAGVNPVLKPKKAHVRNSK